MSFIEELKKKVREIPFINKKENVALTLEFYDRQIQLKKVNSQTVMQVYYIPKAIKAILKEDGYLTTEEGARPRATAMMLSDLASGVLTEFYRFK